MLYFFLICYNSKKFQGIVPPIKRSELDFDPGTISQSTSVESDLRYFASIFYQFQFYKSMCDLSGHEGDLHKCDFYNSKAAGAKLK